MRTRRSPAPPEGARCPGSTRTSSRLSSGVRRWCTRREFSNASGRKVDTGSLAAPLPEWGMVTIPGSVPASEVGDVDGDQARDPARAEAGESHHLAGDEARDG